MASQPFLHFIEEHGTIDDNGEAYMASVQASTPTRKRRTKTEVDEARQLSLLNVFDALSDNNLSLREFLVATFNLRQEVIARKAGQFYATGGPAAIIRLWGEKLEGADNDSTFAKEAIEIVARRVQADLDNAAKDKSFKHPANSISRKAIRKFSLRHIKSSLTNSAPHLTLLLERVLPQSVGGFQPSSAWRPRSLSVHDPIPPSTRERPPWLSVSFSGPDSDIASEEDMASDQSTSETSSASSIHSDTESQCDQDSDWEDESNPNQKMDPCSFVVTVGCMLLFMKNSQSNCFQMMLGMRFGH